MKLYLENLAKIKKADLEFNGITVIAGENNTGKSTIGKLLFSIFNTMYQVEAKIAQQKEDIIFRTIYSLLQEQSNLDKTTPFHSDDFLFDHSPSIRVVSLELANEIISLPTKNKESLFELINNFFHEESYSSIVSNKVISNIVEKVINIFNIPNEKLLQEISTNSFNQTFEQQISPLTNEDLISNIELTIKEKKLAFQFQLNQCNYLNSEFNILHQAFYIDNPFLIDQMNQRTNIRRMKSTDIHLLRHLQKESTDAFTGIFDTVITKERLNNIYDILNDIVEGKIISNRNNEYYLSSKSFHKPINIKNLSTGLKSFTLIKILLENGSLKEKDILILDEPEIHLHPEWQLIYAELLVLLQREFDLTIIITTHSPYFLDAIDVFSAKHNISEKIKYYLAENKEQISFFYDVTNQIDLIYKKLSDPLQKLEQLRNIHP